MSTDEDEPSAGDNQGSLPARRDDQNDDATNENTVEGVLDTERIVNLVVQRIENKLEQHFHLPNGLPAIDKVAEMRERTPELYETWLEITKEQAKTEAYVARAPYEEPAKLARSGRPWTAFALLAILAFCGYLASTGTTGQVIGGILAAIDLVGILAIFAGTNPATDRAKNRPTGDEPGPEQGNGES